MRSFSAAAALNRRCLRPCEKGFLRSARKRYCGVRTAIRCRYPTRTAILRDQTGSCLGAVEIFSDISRIKALEGEMQQARTMAALGEMSATVAHEIRNPLGAMGMWAGLLERDLPPGDKRGKTLKKIIEGLSRLNKIVSNLLIYTRPIRAELRKMALEDSLSEIVDFVDIEIDRLGLKIDLVRDWAVPGRTFVLADPEKIEQVVMNLCLNAMQAMPDGGALTVGIESNPDKASGYVCFCRPRYRRRNSRGGPPEDFRPILYHAGERHRPRTCNCKEIRGVPCGIYRCSKRGNARRDVPDIFTEIERVGGRAMDRKKILVVDDNELFRDSIADMLSRQNFDVVQAPDGRSALNEASHRRFDLVISDMKMPYMSGIELLDKMKVVDPDAPFLIITAFGAVETAVEAMKKGAYDFIQKSDTLMRELELTVIRALQYQTLVDENRRLKTALNSKWTSIGKTAAMEEVRAMVARVADSRSTVLITGESGTGKELIARSIHFQSRRNHGPFIKVNCAALPDGLIESELFGHEKGAFTGAIMQKRGKFEAASGGTLLLDEIGELPMAGQAKLLRALQEREIHKVGGDQPIEIDVRIVVTTNRKARGGGRPGQFPGGPLLSPECDANPSSDTARPARGYSEPCRPFPEAL